MSKTICEKWERQKDSGTPPPSASGSFLGLPDKGNRDPVPSLVQAF